MGVGSPQSLNATPPRLVNRHKTPAPPTEVRPSKLKCEEISGDAAVTAIAIGKRVNQDPVNRGSLMVVWPRGGGASGEAQPDRNS